MEPRCLEYLPLFLIRLLRQNPDSNYATRIRDPNTEPMAVAPRCGRMDGQPPWQLDGRVTGHLRIVDEMPMRNYEGRVVLTTRSSTKTDRFRATEARTVVVVVPGVVCVMR